MGDVILKCPLCCQKTFANKAELVDHLSLLLESITCPICREKLSSLPHLVEHLTLNKCQPDIPTQAIIFNIGPENSNNDINVTLEQLSSSKIIHSNEINDKDTMVDPLAMVDTVDSSGTIGNGSELGKMYVELLSKQLAKPCLQTQELKLVKDNGVSRYVILANEESNMSLGNTVVTKQNNDGTISLTTVKDMKVESDTLITPETDTEDSLEEVYSCNTCKVSFTSVIDHIQNFHNDQDVVVEEPMDASGDDVQNEISDDVTGDKQTSRRMITDTGDIVEAPLMEKTEFSIDADSESMLQPKKELAVINNSHEMTDKDGRVFTRRYVQIEKFCDSIVKKINEPAAKDGPYHKVVVKEMRTHTGQVVDVYNCMSCHIYVTSLDDFKSHPCKVLKYTCPHCPVTYENSKSLCAHMKVHKQKQEGVSSPLTFECETCCTVFPTNKSLKLHKRMHDPIKSRPIDPPVASPEGTEASQDKYLCGVCDKLIPIEYRNVHKDSHDNKPMYNCDVCNKKFTSSEYLEMHMNVHSMDKVPMNKQDKSLPYSCLYCERRFARPHEKVKHERIHTGERPHSCEICGKSFRVSYCLTLHMRTHTGARPYACSHCGKRFKAYSVYNHHLLTHSEVRAYKCPYCPKAFKTSVQLAGHKNSHTKPFSCQHCNRPFASLYAVRVHTETHARQNNLKFSCTLCGASYARAFALKDHVKQVHKQNCDKDELGVPVTIKSNDDAWISTEGIETETEEIQITKDLPHEVQLL